MEIKNNSEAFYCHIVTNLHSEADVQFKHIHFLVNTQAMDPRFNGDRIKKVNLQSLEVFSRSNLSSFVKTKDEKEPVILIEKESEYSYLCRPKEFSKNKKTDKHDIVFNIFHPMGITSEKIIKFAQQRFCLQLDISLVKKDDHLEEQTPQFKNFSKSNIHLRYSDYVSYQDNSENLKIIEEINSFLDKSAFFLTKSKIFYYDNLLSALSTTAYSMVFNVITNKEKVIDVKKALTKTINLSLYFENISYLLSKNKLFINKSDIFQKKVEFCAQYLSRSSGIQELVKESVYYHNYCNLVSFAKEIFSLLKKINGRNLSIIENFSEQFTAMPLCNLYSVSINPKELNLFFMNHFLEKIGTRFYLLGTVDWKGDDEIKESTIQLMNYLTEKKWFQASGLLIRLGENVKKSFENDEKIDIARKVWEYQFLVTHQIFEKYIREFLFFDKINKKCLVEAKRAYDEIQQELVEQNEPAFKNFRDWLLELDPEKNRDLKILSHKLQMIDRQGKKWKEQIVNLSSFFNESEESEINERVKLYIELLKESYRFSKDFEHHLITLQEEIDRLQELVTVRYLASTEEEIQTSQFYHFLDTINQRIVRRIEPYSRFISHVSRLFAVKDETLKNKKDTVAWHFGVDEGSLQLLCTEEKTYEELKAKLDEEEIRPSDRSFSNSDEANEEFSISSPISSSKDEVVDEKSNFEEIFNEKKRNKFLPLLFGYLKRKGIAFRIESGQGSHRKLFIGGGLIVLPKGKMWKTGTEQSIKEQIQHSVQTEENKQPSQPPRMQKKKKKIKKRK